MTNFCPHSFLHNKGRAKTGDASSLATAKREWVEETGLGLSNANGKLQVLDMEAITDYWGCHYFLADWIGNAEVGTCHIISDLQIPEDIVCVRWTPCREVLYDQQMSRGSRRLLEEALRRMKSRGMLF